VCIARGADVKIDATMSLASDTPKIYVTFETAGIKKGDKMRGVLIAEDVGEAAPANTKVLETSLDMDEDTKDGEFNFSKPTNGWPEGKYRVEIYVNDKLTTTLKFTVTGGGE
jgi:outer membrane usher protein FimD/PapC